MRCNLLILQKVVEYLKVEDVGFEIEWLPLSHLYNDGGGIHELRKVPTSIRPYTSSKAILDML